MVKLSAPWVTFYREIVELFGADPDIRIEYDEEAPSVTLYVEGQDKADAIQSILPVEKNFGNVTMSITVVPSNDKQKTKADIYRTAFNGNPAFSYAVTDEGITTNPITYVVFRNKVVQFWNDNLGDINGNISTLYQDIARDALEDEEVMYCTDTDKNLGVKK